MGKSDIKTGPDAGEGYYYILAILLSGENYMKTPMDDTHRVEDTAENLEMCICKVCPTFRDNKLADYPPNTLFCARGRSKIPSKVKTTKCYCLGCDVFIKRGLVIDHLCINR
jgi:hypothetical protein